MAIATGTGLAIAGGAALIGAGIQAFTAVQAAEEAGLSREEALAFAEQRFGIGREQILAAGEQGRADITAGAQQALTTLTPAQQQGIAAGGQLQGLLQQGPGIDTAAIGAPLRGPSPFPSELQALAGADPFAAERAGISGLQQQGLRGIEDISRAGAFTGLERDPGFAFRQRAGEQAIQRAASAAGGRISGRTLQALQARGQELASQEFGAAAERRLQVTGQQLRQAELASQRELTGAGLGLQATGGVQAGQLGRGALELGLGTAQARDVLGRVGAATDIGRLGVQQFQAQTGPLLGLAGVGAGLTGQAAGIQAGTGQALSNLGLAQGQALIGAGGQLGALGAGLIPQGAGAATLGIGQAGQDLLGNAVLLAQLASQGGGGAVGVPGQGPAETFQVKGGQQFLPLSQAPAAGQPALAGQQFLPQQQGLAGLAGQAAAPSQQQFLQGLGQGFQGLSFQGQQASAEELRQQELRRQMIQQQRFALQGGQPSLAGGF